MTTHEQFADELPLYAIGSLAGEERAALDRHLEQCASCRQEIERLRGDLALLALSAMGPSPPQRARQKLLKAVAREPRPRAVSVPRPRRMLPPIFACVVLAIFAMLLWRENRRQREQIAALTLRAAQEQTLLKQAQDVVGVLTAPDAQHVTLVAAQSKPQPIGKAIYLPRKGGLVFMASNLAPLPPQKTYQLWLLPARGGAPMPAGTFMPDARGAATEVDPARPRCRLYWWGLVSEHTARPKTLTSIYSPARLVRLERRFLSMPLMGSRQVPGGLRLIPAFGRGNCTMRLNLCLPCNFSVR